MHTAIVTGGTRPDDIAQTVVDLLRHPGCSLPSKVEIRPARTK